MNVDDGDEPSLGEGKEKTPLRKEESDEDSAVLMSSPAGLRAERLTIGSRIG